MPPPSRPHVREPHDGALRPRLNMLRAGVLGAQDGIVSTAGIVLGVAGATSDRTVILVAGFAGLVAGALSMAGGEYASVSTQLDTERATLAKERWELETMPEAELEELTGLYEQRGLPRALARQVAEELTSRDALAAHAEVELGIDPDALTSPWQAAAVSALAFALGAALPLLAMLAVVANARVAVTVGAVAVALFATGWAAARLGGVAPLRSALRVLTTGVVAMAATYAIGALVGAGL